jgi:phospholipid transport system substrate-binding protein
MKGNEGHSMRTQFESKNQRGARILWSLVVLVSILSWPVQGSAEMERTPTSVARSTMNELLYVLIELRDPSRATQRTWEFEQAVRRHFRYEAMAKRSLGDAWDRRGRGDRQEYVRLFIHLLRDELAERLRGYGPSEVKYLSEQQEGGRAEVSLGLTSEGLETSIEFSISRISGAWAIDDLRIDGVSLVERYQTQFARILENATFADLIDRMKQRTLLVEAFEKAGP